MVSNSSGSILGTLFTKSSKYLPILVSGWILLAFKCKCWNKFNFNIQHAYLNRNYNHTCIYQFSEKVSYPELTSTSSTYSKTSVSFSWRLEHARSTWVKSLTMLTVRLLLDFPCWIKSTGKKHVIFNIYSFWHLSVLLQNNHSRNIQRNELSHPQLSLAHMCWFLLALEWTCILLSFQVLQC